MTITMKPLRALGVLLGVWVFIGGRRYRIKWREHPSRRQARRWLEARRSAAAVSEDKS